MFAWVDVNVVPDSATVAIARDDDYFFGVLHSRLHEVWSLRMGTWLGVGNDPRYTPTTTFETFPFPWPPGQEPRKTDTMYGVPTHDGVGGEADTTYGVRTNEERARYEAIAAAAKQLHEERHGWLNPVGVSEKELKERTLTNFV